MLLPRQIIVSFVITFTVGACTGAYLYLTGFATTFRVPEVASEPVVPSLVIEGRQYGGFRLAEPPSFQLLRDGSFRYIPPADTLEAAVIEEGIVPLQLMSEVRSVLTAQVLAQASERIEPEFCESYVDGIEYAYEITLAGETYSLDTCGTNFSRESELGSTLAKLWDYFAMRE